MPDYAIAALTANGSYTVFRVGKQVCVSSRTVNHHASLYLCYSSRTNETKSPGVFIACSLPLCDEVALR